VTFHRPKRHHAVLDQTSYPSLSRRKAAFLCNFFRISRSKSAENLFVAYSISKGIDEVHRQFRPKNNDAHLRQEIPWFEFQSIRIEPPDQPNNSKKAGVAHVFDSRWRVSSGIRGVPVTVLHAVATFKQEAAIDLTLLRCHVDLSPPPGAALNLAIVVKRVPTSW
jgi:hypothetical protein